MMGSIKNFYQLILCLREWWIRLSIKSVLDESQNNLKDSRKGLGMFVDSIYNFEKGTTKNNKCF